MWRQNPGRTSRAPGFVALLVLGAAAFTPAWAAEPTAADEAAAQAALLPLKQGLKRALETALAEGPIAAVDACRIEAPRIAAESAQPGVRIGRTSHRLRNPANAPAVWMQPLLAEFERAGRAEGKGRLVDLGSEGVGYVEPIHLQPLCVTCHGTQVAPELLAHIRKLYPEDRAVGFEPGDFRGLFWVVLEARKAEQ